MVKGMVGVAWRPHLPLAIGDDSGGGRRANGSDHGVGTGGQQLG